MTSILSLIIETIGNGIVNTNQKPALQFLIKRAFCRAPKRGGERKRMDFQQFPKGEWIY
ncbi:hypothetical protein GA8_17835 [Geobacillus sp. A8]|nr:hypothetical protein GA8_17835 [Geobacillus sp. A8]